MRRMILWPVLGLAVLAIAVPLSVQAGDDEIEAQPRIEYEYGPNMRYGVSVIRDRFGRPIQKRLTFSSNGATNHTMVRLADRDVEFGGPAGKWIEKDVRVRPDKTVHSTPGTRSIWEIGSLQISQILRIVPSRQTVEVAPGVYKHSLNTLRVQYHIKNLGPKAHKVGLRVMLDTLIGSNDGVPFTVPGYPDLVSTSADFRTSAEVPDFIQALEIPDPSNPGTVAHLSLKLGGIFESPSRVSLTHWRSNPAWEVPLADINGDSAVALYWSEKVLNPGQHRDLGFAYGLGTVASLAGKSGALGVTVGGAFEEGTHFTVTAYIHHPVKGQTVELSLPAGLEMTTGKAKTPVPPPVGAKKDLSIVTWRAKALRQGRFSLKIHSSNGPTLTRIITITERQKGSAAAPVVPLPYAGLLPVGSADVLEVNPARFSQVAAQGEESSGQRQ